MSEMSNSQKREWAQTLYVHHGMGQKQIAAKVNVSEKTIGNWKEKFGWDTLQAAMLTTKPQQLKMFYSQLDALNKEILAREQKFPTPSEGDTIGKISKSIRNLENEAGIADIISVCMMLGDFIRVYYDDLDFVKKAIESFDLFIKSKLSSKS